MSIHYAIVGAGRQGSAAAYDLAMHYWSPRSKLRPIIEICV